MKRLLAGLLALVFLAGSGIAADAKKMVLRWHGQSFFDLTTSEGTRIVFDPHAIEAYGRILVSANLVLISHLHNDHTQMEAITNREKAKVLMGLKFNGNKFEWNLIDETFREVHVRTVGTYHDDAQGMERGKNTVFIVEADGLRVVHLGDLGHLLSANQIKQIGKVDVLMIPVGGVYTVNGSEARKVVEQLKPRQYIIPMHCGTNVYDDLLPVDEFLEDQKPANIKRMPTNQLILQTDFKPAEPVIAILNWK